jgi:hypothetical protein
MNLKIMYVFVLHGVQFVQLGPQILPKESLTEIYMAL